MTVHVTLFRSILAHTSFMAALTCQNKHVASEWERGGGSVSKMFVWHLMWEWLHFSQAAEQCVWECKTIVKSDCDVSYQNTNIFTTIENCNGGFVWYFSYKWCRELYWGWIGVLLCEKCNSYWVIGQAGKADDYRHARWAILVLSVYCAIPGILLIWLFLHPNTSVQSM